MSNTITIDGKEYDLDKMPQEVLSHLTGLHFCDLELQRLQMSIATVQTSRAAYANAINSALGISPAAVINETKPDGNFNFASDTVKFN